MQAGSLRATARSVTRDIGVRAWSASNDDDDDGRPHKADMLRTLAASRSVLPVMKYPSPMVRVTKTVAWNVYVNRSMKDSTGMVIRAWSVRSGFDPVVR